MTPLCVNCFRIRTKGIHETHGDRSALKWFLLTPSTFTWSCFLIEQHPFLVPPSLKYPGVLLHHRYSLLPAPPPSGSAFFIYGKGGSLSGVPHPVTKWNSFACFSIICTPPKALRTEMRPLRLDNGLERQPSTPVRPQVKRLNNSLPVPLSGIYLQEGIEPEQHYSTQS